MLIDIFSRRYDGITFRDSFEKRDGRLLVQAFRILAEDVYPYYINGKEDCPSATFWTNLNSRLSRELGIQELSKQWLSYTTKWNGNEHLQTHKHTMLKVCENWMMQAVVGSADEHIKDRISLIELGFRQRNSEIGALNAQPITTAVQTATNVISTRASISVPANPIDKIKEWRAQKTGAFRASIDELNARFRQAGYALNYHNGYIQVSSDDLIQREVENPFWALVASAEWANVDLDMKEALDLRDSDGRDPAFYAARSLESAIKIISDRNGWTRGTEKGAHNYIDNLGSKTNSFVTVWESESLKSFFTNVRNPFGHGAGSAEMPNLSRPQTEWAIEFSMSWVKNLIRRL